MLDRPCPQIPVSWRRATPGTRIFVGGATLGVVAATCGLLLFLQLGSSALKATNFSAIKPGMTRQQVSALLGGPPGDYGRYADGIIESGDGSVLQTFYVPIAGPSRPERWQDDRNTFFIFFDDSDRVVAASKATYVRRYSKNSPLNRIQRALSSILR